MYAKPRKTIEPCHLCDPHNTWPVPRYPPIKRGHRLGSTEWLIVGMIPLKQRTWLRTLDAIRALPER